jgi:hypothetical protein
VFVLPKDVRCKLLFLGSCGGILLSQGRYSELASLALGSTAGWAAHYISTFSVKSSSYTELLVFYLLLSCGETVGRAVMLLNRMQTLYYRCPESYFLLGDPAARPLRPMAGYAATAKVVSEVENEVVFKVGPVSAAMGRFSGELDGAPAFFRGADLNSQFYVRAEEDGSSDLQAAAFLVVDSDARQFHVLLLLFGAAVPEWLTLRASRTRPELPYENWELAKMAHNLSVLGSLGGVADETLRRKEAMGTALRSVARGFAVADYWVAKYARLVQSLVTLDGDLRTYQRAILKDILDHTTTHPAAFPVQNLHAFVREGTVLTDVICFGCGQNVLERSAYYHLEDGQVLRTMFACPRCFSWLVPSSSLAPVGNGERNANSAGTDIRSARACTS